MKILEECSKLFFLELSTSEDGLIQKHLKENYPLLSEHLEAHDITISSEGIRYTDNFVYWCEKYYPEALV